jgi:drug/metabolite transporter superfamily protein YnfA
MLEELATLLLVRGGMCVTASWSWGWWGDGITDSKLAIGGTIVPVSGVRLIPYWPEEEHV